MMFESEPEQPGVRLSLMQLIKLGSILVAIVACFYGVRLDFEKMADKVSDNTRSIERAGHDAEAAKNQMSMLREGLSGIKTSNELLHRDLNTVVHMLYEKRYLRSPDIISKAKPEPEPEVAVVQETEETPEIRKRNAAMRAMRATGKAIGKITEPFREEVVTPDQ